MLDCSLITSLDELTDHRDRWEALRQETGGTIFSSYGVVSTWFKCFGDQALPRIILINDGQELVGAAPMFFRQRGSKGLTIKVLSLSGGALDKVWTPTATALFPAERRDVLARLMAEIGQLEWNTLTAFHLLDTPSTRSLLDSIRTTWYAYDYRLDKNVMLTLPEKGNISSMFDRKARENLRNRTNKLEREKGGAEFRIITEDMIDSAVDTYAQHHAVRYGPRGGSLFQSSDNVQFLKDVIRMAMEGGYGYAHELLIDGEVAAQSLGFYEGDTAFPYRFGMNDAFSMYSPGWQLQCHSLSYLRDMGLTHCSLGAGDESYKYRMGGTESPLLGVMARRGGLGLLDRVAHSSMARFIGGGIGRKKKVQSAQP